MKLNLILKRIHYRDMADLVRDTSPATESCNLPPASTLALAPPRMRVLSALSEIVEWTLQQYSPDTDKGAEFGCGASAFFAENLLPSRLMPGWRMYDANPQAVRYAREHSSGYFSPAQIMEGSSYDMDRLGISQSPLIVGYSSFDSMSYLELAMQQAYNNLPEGGKLVLFQDVLPASYLVVAREARKRILSGRLDDLLFGAANPESDIIVAVQEDGSLISAMEYLDSELVKAAMAAGFSVRYQSCVENEAEVRFDPNAHTPYMAQGPVNTFSWESGILLCGYDPELASRGMARERAEVYVCVFEKPVGQGKIPYLGGGPGDTPLTIWPISPDGRTFHLDRQYLQCGSGPCLDHQPGTVRVLSTADELMRQGYAMCQSCIPEPLAAAVRQ